MKILTFNITEFHKEPIQVECRMQTGLAKITLTGLPNTLMKESVLRIKQSLLTLGIGWPKDKEIIFNFTPNATKKNGIGYDLAIAISLLLKMNPGLEDKFTKLYGDTIYAWGDLNLKGDITFPEEGKKVNFEMKEDTIFCPPSKVISGNKVIPINNLQDLSFLSMPQAQTYQDPRWSPPTPNPWVLLSNEQATLIKLISLTNASVILSGSAGSGKTTFCDQIQAYLPEPSKSRQKEIKRMGYFFNEERDWLPYVSPHHSIPRNSLIGGNTPFKMGEASRAHGGVLLLDEFLEFKRDSLEALREAQQKKKIFHARAGKTYVVPADFLLMATTNLCPCGKKSPNYGASHCNYSLMKCNSVLNKLSGPLLDRFDILVFSNHWVDQEKTVIQEDLQLELKEIHQWRSKQKLPTFKEDLNTIKHKFKDYLPRFDSFRRYESLVKLARGFATLEKNSEINQQHLISAEKLAHKNFKKLFKLH